MIVLRVVYTVVVNRALGIAGKGLFELIKLAPNILITLGTFGYNESNIYFAGKSPKKIPSIIGNSYRLALTFAMFSVALGAIFILLPINRHIFETIPIWVGILALAVVPIGIVDLFLQGIVYGENRIWVLNWHQLIRAIAGILYIGALVIIYQLGVQGAVYGYIGIHVTLAIFTFVVLTRFHKPFGGKFDKELAWESWKFARFSWGANLAQYLLLYIDVWLLSFLIAGPDKYIQIGLYTTAASVITAIWIIPSAVQTALIPKITQKGESERKKLVPPSLRMVTIIVALAMIVLALVGKWALDFLYNDPSKPGDWTEAYVPMMLLMPAIFSMSFAKVFAADFFSRGKPYVSMWVSILALVNNVIINFILIPRDWMIGTLPIGGMNGAAIASSIAYTISFVLFLILYVRESGEKSRDIFIPKKEDINTLWAWMVITFKNAGDKNKSKSVVDIIEDKGGDDDVG